MALNAVRERLEAAFASREAELERGALAQLDEQLDVTLPGTPLRRGRLHPLTQIRREVEDIFLGLGYEIVDSREVETVWHNFDALNQPLTHPVAVAPRHVLRRRRHAAAHAHLHGADPRNGGASAADLHRDARARLPARHAEPSLDAELPPGRGARGRPRHHARRSERNADALLPRDVRRGPRRSHADELLPLHGAVGRIRRHVLPLRRQGLCLLQVHGLVRDGRRGRRSTRLCSRTSATTRRSGPGSRGASASTASRHSATAFPTSACSGRTTCAS